MTKKYRENWKTAKISAYTVTKMQTVYTKVLTDGTKYHVLIVDGLY